MHSTQAEWWCTRHSQSRHDALRAGVGEAQWLAAAVPFSSGKARRPAELRLPPRRFCPDRDATAGDLCRRHEVLLTHARRRVHGFTEDAWAARQVAFPGAGECRVADCLRRAESEPSLCPSHRRAWVVSRRPTGPKMQRWLMRWGGDPDAGVVFLAGLHPLVAAEIRYALWTHTKNAAPARWHPMWVRRLVKSCREGGMQSLLELDPSDPTWTPQPDAVNRIAREMVKDVQRIHRSRGDTRELGYLDTNYWGFRFPDRRSAFDLTCIPQRWLRDLTWDYLASELDGPGRPRTQGSFETGRHAIASFGTYLADCDAQHGEVPSALSDSTAREFVGAFAKPRRSSGSGSNTGPSRRLSSNACWRCSRVGSRTRRLSGRSRRRRSRCRFGRGSSWMQSICPATRPVRPVTRSRPGW